MTFEGDEKEAGHFPKSNCELVLNNAGILILSRCKEVDKLAKAPSREKVFKVINKD